jgi:hypothetical protein
LSCKGDDEKEGFCRSVRRKMSIVREEEDREKESAPFRIISLESSNVSTNLPTPPAAVRTYCCTCAGRFASRMPRSWREKKRR